MPVELLIRMKDGPGGRFKGDIVSAKTVPHRGWGRDEGPPNYCIIRVEDKIVDEISGFIKRHEPYLFDKDGNPIAFRRNKFRVNIDSLPQPDREAIALKQKVLINWSVLQSRLIDVVALDGLGE